MLSIEAGDGTRLPPDRPLGTTSTPLPAARPLPSPLPPLLPQYEWRFGALVRLVKLWARHWGVNDSTAGTLNSFALTMLVRCRWGWG